MVYNIRCGSFYNCDEKYAIGHQCKEHKLSQIYMTTQSMIKDINTKGTSELQVEDTNTQTRLDIKTPFPHEESLISLHALLRILTPQDLKVMGYIKH
jgi:hypothetical protein